MDEWDSVQRIRSDEVFTKEKEFCEAMIAKNTPEHDEWELRRDEVETAHTILETNLENAILSPEKYMASVRAAFKRDMLIAQVCMPRKCVYITSQGYVCIVICEGRV